MDFWKGSQTASKSYSEEFSQEMPNVETIYYSKKRRNIAAQELMSGPRISRLLKEEHHHKYELIFDYNTILSGRNAGQAIAGAPRIYDLADDLADMIRHTPQIPAPLSFIGGAISEKLIQRSLTSSSAITGTTKALLTKYQVPEHKQHVIPNGVSLDLFERVEMDDVIDVRLDHNEFLIAYLGVLREWVDFDPVFRALKSILRNSKARMVIIGDEGDRRRVENQARHYGVLESVTFVGTIPYKKVRRYLAACDCGIIPFSATGTADMALPLKLFEYLACGIPVLTTRIRAIEELFCDVAYFYTDAIELENSLMDILENPHVASDRTERGRRIVQRDFTWERQFAKYDELIERLMDRGR